LDVSPVLMLLFGSRLLAQRLAAEGRGGTAIKWRNIL
jgi:hypothetical protein